MIRDIIFSYLPDHSYEVFLFGSRAKGSNRTWSDYDVGIVGKDSLPRKILFDIEEALENSDIPYKVDVVDFSRVSDRFKNIAGRTIKKWQISQS